MNAKKRTKRTYTEDFRVKVLQDLAQSGETVSAVSRRYDIDNSLIHWWLKRAREMQRKSGEPPPDITKGPAGRNVYSAAYKQRQVERVQAGESVAAVSADIGLADSILSRWCRQAREAPAPAPLPVMGRPPTRPQINSSPPLGDGAWSHVMEAYLYLRNAEKELKRALDAGETREDESHLLMKLAYRCLGRATGKK